MASIGRGSFMSGSPAGAIQAKFRPDVRGPTTRHTDVPIPGIGKSRPRQEVRFASGTDRGAMSMREMPQAAFLAAACGRCMCPGGLP